MSREYRSLLVLLAALALVSGCINQPPAERNETDSDATGNWTGNATNGVDICPLLCPDTNQTCPDGFVASCKNKCVDGVCTTCIPDCSGHECRESWNCTGWGPCMGGFERRTCVNMTLCSMYKPIESRPCAPGLPTHVVISEVYYDTVGDDSLHEWIEVYNPTFENITLSGYSLLDNSKDSMKWYFPNGSVIQPGSYYVVARNAQAFRTLVGCVPEASGFTFQLNNDADHVSLFDNQGELVDFVGWGGDSGWNLTTKTDTSIKRKPINVDTDSWQDWIKDQEAHPGSCFFSE